jgi:hypothetical protein
MNIYLDMDDVVADWHSAAQDFLKMRWNKEAERIPQHDWDRIKNDSHFYLDLPLKTGAHELVSWCRIYTSRNPGTGLYFLTALPHDYSMPYAAQDKVWWANRHFPGIPVFFGPFSHDKYRYCQNAQDILIDDRYSNCSEWVAAGGRSHVYKSWEECHSWIESTLGTL